METDKLGWFQKTLLIFVAIATVFLCGKTVISRAEKQDATTQKSTEKIQQVKKQTLASLFVSERKKGEYVVDCLGQIVIDNKGNPRKNQILLSITRLNSVSSSSDKDTDDVVLIRLEAVSITAKEEIKKPVVNLLEPIYSSVLFVAKKIITIKKARTQEEFNKAFKDYKKSLEEADNLVSLHGFKVIENFYVFQGEKM